MTKEFSAEALKNVLVVDDQIEMTKIVATQLKPQGFNCLTAESVPQAKKILDNTPISIIICDWQMPDEDGLDFCKFVKSNAELSHIYFIILTAYNETFKKETALLNGVDDYITKPFDYQELVSRINIAYRVCSLQKLVIDQERTKAFTQMSTTIAHEINNPLTGLIGFLQLTKSRLEKNDTLDEKGVQKTLTSIEKCIEQSQRIKTIVQKMRQISKPKLKMYGSTQIVDMDTQTKPKKK